jgi:polysaccharide biosynthesis/export protein
MKQKPVFLLLLALVFLSGSCVSNKKLTYLQYSGERDFQERDISTFVTPETYKLIPYDILFVRVITPDPQWSEIFNVMATGQGGGLTGESAALMGYPVDDEGNIEMPYIGKVPVGGKTIAETKVTLDSVFKNYLNDAALTVRLVNNYVSIVGEVNMPGRYPLTKDRINVFEALSLAGDLSEMSNRQRVQLIRPSSYGPVVKEFSLNDRSILTSEFYYIMPNDVLYAEPLKGRSFQVNAPVWTLFLSTITSALGMIAFFRTL